jgi:hypothetical protein
MFRTPRETSGETEGAHLKARWAAAIGLAVVTVGVVALLLANRAERGPRQSVPPEGAAVSPSSGATEKEVTSPTPAGQTGAATSASSVPTSPASTPSHAAETPSTPSREDQEQFPLGKPKANAQGEAFVPFELVQKIASKTAQGKWGAVALGPALACCDADGNALAYMFPCSFGAGAFPTYSAILSSVQEGRRMTEEGNAEDSEKGRQKSIGEGQYGTVVVSARYDRYPVPLYMHYLSPYYYNGDLAAALAAKALSAQNVTLERIYFLDGGHDQYFEFSSGTQRVLVHAYGLFVRRPEEVLKRAGPGVTLDPKLTAELQKEWAKFIKEAQ